MSAWVRGNLLWKGRIFKKKSEIPQNDLTKPNIEGRVFFIAMTEHFLQRKTWLPAGAEQTEHPKMNMMDRNIILISQLSQKQPGYPH